MTTKKRITQAAYELFGSKGFHRASTKEIAQMAGTNEATIFRLFGDKGSLYDAAADYAANLFPYEDMERALNSSTDVRKTALAFSYLLFKSLTPQVQSWPYLISIENPSPAAVKTFGDVNKRFFGMIGAWAERMKAAGSIRPDVQVPLCAYILMLMLNEYHMDVVSHGKLDTEAVDEFMYANLPAIVDTWLNGVASRA